MTNEITIEPFEVDGFDVVEHTVHPKTSVLAGTPQRIILDTFERIEDALAKYPQAIVLERTTMIPGFMRHPVSDVPPSDFDPSYAGESWETRRMRAKVGIHLDNSRGAKGHG